MKILQLSTSVSGGAGSAASRLNQALNQIGINSEICSRENLSQGENWVTSHFGFKETISKFVTYVQIPGRLSKDTLVTPLNVDFSNEILRIVEKNKFDLIHIHAFYNFLSMKGLSRLVRYGKKIVFTLHDERLFTGGCHYSRDCSQFESDCARCPQIREAFQPLIRENFANSKMIIGDLGESLAAVVTPSQWLASQVEKSRIFRGRKARVIRNGIPEIYFSTWKKSTLASPESLRVGFVSSDLQNPYKGFEILLASLELIERDFPGRTELKVLGSGNVKSSLSRFSQAISKSDSATIEFIDSIDVLVVPSLQDNLPNVIPEALSRGKAIIGSDVGGIKEILQQFKMPIFQSGNVNQLSKMLIELKVQRYHSPKIRELARELFGFDVVARNHQSLYEEIM